MTRVTSMSKIVRLTATPASVARPRYLSVASKATSLAHKELSADGRSSDGETSRRAMTTSHGPARVLPNPGRTVPLMQTFFHSSSATAARQHDVAALDFVLPALHAEPAAGSDTTFMRVPLLPDNFSPDRSAFFAVETSDAPLPAAEISVVAAHPDKVLSALTEVEGIGIDGVELKFVHEHQPRARPEPGMLRNVWHGLVDSAVPHAKTSSL